MRIAEILRKAREDCHLSLSRASQELEVSEATIRRVEAGEVEPSYYVISRMVRVYAVDPRKLFAGGGSDFVEEMAKTIRLLELPTSGLVELLDLISRYHGRERLLSVAKALHWPVITGGLG